MQELSNSTEEELLLGENEAPQREEVDYASFSKTELLKALKDLQTKDMNAVTAELSDIKSAFDDLFNEEKAEALERFKQEGGAAADFEYRSDQESTTFYKLADELHLRVKSYLTQKKELEKSAQRKKESVVEELREVVNSNEVTNATFNRVKELQQAWREANDVTSYTESELWRNYKALLDIYYNNRSISFELKELDRKKNYELKAGICEAVEALVNEESIPKALGQLSAYHKEYKHIGPIPEELREELWQRLKAASQVLYDKRDAYEKEFALEKKENSIKKAAIIDQLQVIIDTPTIKISDWNKRTKEIGEQQDLWKSIGPVDKEIAKNITKQFWTKVKAFYQLKNEFFNQLDEEKKVNLKAKETLCEKVEALKDNENFKDTADKIKRLQADWKNTGPVSQKQSDAIYARFREACDYFFNRRKEFFAEKDEEFADNSKAKRELIASISQLKEDQITEFTDLIAQYDAIGFVPKDKVESISKSYKQATNAFVEKLPEGAQKDELEITIELGSLKGHPNAGVIIGKHKDKVRYQMNDIKADISTLKTNIEFFARSKNADKLREEVDQKIAKAEKQLEELKRKMQLINNFEY